MCTKDAADTGERTSKAAQTIALRGVGVQQEGEGRDSSSHSSAWPLTAGTLSLVQEAAA